MQKLTVTLWESKNRPITYIHKSVIQKWYLDEGLTRKEFCEKFPELKGIFDQSYCRWYTKEERKANQRLKIAFSQRRLNSNKVNTGKPRMLLDKEVLSGYLEQGFAYEKIAGLMKVAPQTVRANAEYFGLVPDEYGFSGWLSPTEVQRLEQLDTLFGTGFLVEYKKQKNKRDILSLLKDIQLVEKSLTDMKTQLRRMRKAAVTAAQVRDLDVAEYNLPGSQINAFYGKAFEEYGLRVWYEHRIGDRLFDLYFPDHKIVVEVDPPHFHQTEKAKENDLYKTRLAEEAGYILYRISSAADKYTTIQSNADECLQRLGLNQYVRSV